MRKIGRKECLALLSGVDSKGDAKWVGRHSPCTCPNGSSGFASDYLCNGKPVIRIVISNCHDFSTVYAL